MHAFLGEIPKTLHVSLFFKVSQQSITKGWKNQYMVLPGSYIEHKTGIRQVRNNPSIFPRCNSNHDVADQFTLIVDCHRVLNNNGHILGLRCGNRS